MKILYYPNKCHKCGVDNGIYKNEIIPLGENYFFDYRYYECWYCKTQYENVILKKIYDK